MRLSCKYKIDKHYLAECFDEYLPLRKKSHKGYWLAVGLTLFSALLFFFSKQHQHVAILMLILAVIELLSIRYERSWWLLRQSIAKSTGSIVEITLKEEGINVHSIHNETFTPWSKFSKIVETKLGFLLFVGQSNPSYLSKMHLGHELVQILKQRVSDNTDNLEQSA